MQLLRRLPLAKRVAPNSGLSVLIRIIGAVALAACAVSDPVGDDCVTGADCESGACHDGVCVNANGGTGLGGDAQSSTGTSTGGNGAGGDPSAGGSISSTGGEGGTGGAGGSGVCSPNHDGIVARDEVPLAAGLGAKFRIATNATFDTSGTVVGGTKTWDLAGAFSGDHTTFIETLDLTGAWFEDAFPGASYAAKLSDASPLLGVFEITNDSLLLRGVVSPEDGFSRTELTYDPPVVVLAFPLKVGDTYETTSTVSGVASGVFSFYTETYENQVDARGQVITPFSTFDSLRIGVDLTRIVGALVTTQKQFVFVTECFGTIATLASQSGETGNEFSNVSEIKRLSP